MLKRIASIALGVACFVALGISIPVNAGSFTNSQANWDKATEEFKAAHKAAM